MPTNKQFGKTPINWETEAAKLRKLYTKQLEMNIALKKQYSMLTHELLNAITSLPNDLKELDPELEVGTEATLNHIIENILEKYDGKSN